MVVLKTVTVRQKFKVDAKIMKICSGEDKIFNALTSFLGYAILIHFKITLYLQVLFAGWLPITLQFFLKFEME